MEIIILGSGGFQTIPRPLCQCELCKEARKKGVPYSRNGPAIFLKDINALFDTPKDIINSINREDLKQIDNIFYTHWHPDHTEGLRVIEEITVDWNKFFTLKNHGDSINVFIPEELKDTILNIRSPNGSYLKYHETTNSAKINFLPFDKSKSFNKIKIAPIKINDQTACYSFIEGNKKVIYMPCDVKPYETLDFLKGSDLFIVGSPYFESPKGLKNIAKNHPLVVELFSMEEIVDIIKKYGIKKTVITHIEEMWRLTYDDYTRLEKKYKKYNIQFSYDGMKIKI